VSESNKNTLAEANDVERARSVSAEIAGLNAKMQEIYLPALQRAQSSSASLRVQGSEFSRELRLWSGRLSGSNANLNGPISATGLPSKSKNLVSSGKSANGDLVMVTTSNTEGIPQGKSGVQFARRTQSTEHEATHTGA